MDKDQRKTYAVEDLQSLRSQDFRRIYTNSVRLSFTPWDVNMTVSAIEEMGPKQPPISINEAMITMSASHFKAFVAAVVQNLRAYEAQHGEIRMPDVQ